jgi:pimeloyl-ACP methyl ester carboxylesterase
MTQSGLVEINGAKLYYETAGAGPAFVMLHSHLLDCRQWDDQFELFAATHRVVRYDARGFGQSSLPPAPFRHADDLEQLLTFLKIEQAALMGCSGGGGISLDFALLHPDRVDGLILVDSNVDGYQPTGPIPPRLLAYFGARQRGDVPAAIELALQVWLDGPRRAPAQVDPAVRERTRAMIAALLARPAVPEAVAQGFQPPALERLGEIKAPTLAIVGAEDDPMLHDIAAVFAARIAGARSMVIPDAGHHPNLEHPQRFNEIVATFLSSIKQR